MNEESEIPVQVLKDFFRVPTPDIPVDYAGRGLLLDSCITNLSLTGIFVRTASPLPEGTTLEVSFCLPGDKETIKSKAIVRWSHKPSEAALKDGAQAAGMGLEFTGLSARHKKLVERYVEAFLNRMRRT